MSHAETLCRRGSQVVAITRHERVGEGLYELALAGEWGAIQPGQFLHVRCGAGYLRRPFSIYQVGPTGPELLVQVKGEGTRWLAGLRAGDTLDVLGPLGHGFAPARQGERVLLVGGGIGVAPLALWVTEAASRGVQVGAAAILGYRRADLVCGVAPFERAGVPVALVSEDGSVGCAGRVTDGLRACLREGNWDRVLTCGPDGMMAAVARIAREEGVACEASLERQMGCGVGVCLVCVVETERGYQRACVEGPVLDALEVTWSSSMQK